MKAQPTTAVLIATVGALVVGGIAAATGPDLLQDGAWILAGVLPLLRLIGDIISDLRRGRPGVDVIALLAVIGALALAEFLTAGIIGLMLATGQYLDEYAAGRAERELTALMQRAPRQAHVVTNGSLHTVPLGEVQPGDALVVKAGEVVPVDGVLTEAAVLDESALTGEPMPVERPAGDRISSGVVNAAESFVFHATATAEASTYAGIIRLVREAQASQAPVARLADRWAGWFVPLTLVLAAGAWAVSGEPIRALAVLVVATPCPLLLAVPIAIVSGISRGARKGVIFRGGAALERLATVRAIVVDKTGTLTVGEPRLAGIEGFDAQVSAEEALRLAASIDQVSSHLIARALVAEARARGLSLDFPDDATEEPGGGITGRLGSTTVAVGNLPWLMESATASAAVHRFRRAMERVAPLSVFIAVDGAVVAAATFDDVIRRDAAGAIRALRRAGVRKLVMATGDHPVVAQSVGLALGVDQVLAECTPAEKVDVLRELSRDGTTAMTGDGINDAPALAAADVGIAMGARGATASSEAADVVLVVDQFGRLVDAVRIAQRSRRIAVESIVLGMGLSLVAMVVAAVGLLPPIAGAITQEVIDVLAIANALRALFDPRNHAAQPKLSPELSAQLRTEHDRLIPRLDEIRVTADRLDALDSVAALHELEALESFLVDEILPHEAEDDRVIYEAVASLLGGDDPLASMSRTHREIFHQIDAFNRVMRVLPSTGPEPADVRDLRRILYGLHAILRLHFEQEEELYASLDDGYAPTPAGRQP
jgi:heavy metal translocating P-type ATPase